MSKMLHPNNVWLNEDWKDLSITNNYLKREDRKNGAFIELLLVEIDGIVRLFLNRCRFVIY